MNPELVKQAILKEEKFFIQNEVDRASFNDYFSLKNITNNSLFGLGHCLSFIVLGTLLFSSEILFIPFILQPQTLPFLSVLGIVLTMIITPLSIAFFTVFKSLKSFYKRKFLKANDEGKFGLYKKMYSDRFYNREVNSDIKSLLKLSLDKEEYYKLATENQHIDYIHALNAIDEKIKKERIFSEKTEVSLDLNKMKEYNIEIINS